MQINKISIKNTPIEKIDDYVFFGVNETLRELELINTQLTTFPTAVKVGFHKKSVIVLDLFPFQTMFYR